VFTNELRSAHPAGSDTSTIDTTMTDVATATGNETPTTGTFTAAAAKKVAAKTAVASTLIAAAHPVRNGW
jgi:hypothetical protein